MLDQQQQPKAPKKKAGSAQLLTQALTLTLTLTVTRTLTLTLTLTPPLPPNQVYSAQFLLRFQVARLGEI